MNSFAQNGGMHRIDCDEAEHAAAILEILNEAIVNSTVLYDYVPRPPLAMTAWFATKRANGSPVVGTSDVPADCSASQVDARSARSLPISRR